MGEDLPSFKKPPVIETALSIQFKPIEDFTNAHLGLFWNRLRAEYPRVSDAEPIQPQIERFGSQLVRRPRLPTFQVVAGHGAARLQMTSADERTMVQLQNGRLVYNWRRLADGRYPGWENVLPRFQTAFGTLKAMLKDEGLGRVEPNQWEVTYVNHMIKGVDWQEPADWPGLLPGFIGHAARGSVGMAEYVEGNWRFLLPEEAGRLHVNVFHGFTGTEPDAPEVLVLQLTARGGIDMDRGIDASSGLVRGRAAIVQMFAAATGQVAHQRWERER
jgi:uncharacterized protein (TIGR04255 family)